MEHVPLGPLSVSRVGLGCNNFGGRLDFERTRIVVDAALEAGITFFDTANVYGNVGGSERLLGELLRGRRHRVVLATKFGYDVGDGVEARGAPEYVRRSVDASLGRLQTDRVDLLYYHWPDGVTPIAETVGTMAELVHAGKARALGVSNVSLEQLDEASRAAEIVAVQNEYSLLARDAERDFLPRCRALGIGFVPYFPLAAGLLTGKYRSGAPPPEGARLADRNVFAEGGRVTTRVPAGAATLEKVELLEAFARARGRALLDLAIGALASRPGVVSVIVGAMNAEQVRANAAAADWRLTPDELALLP